VKWRRYPKYKPSGVEWLGEVPEHWAIKPLMALTEQRRPIMYGIVLPGPDMEDGPLIVKGGDVKPGRLTPDMLCRTTYEIEAAYVRSRLKVNDVVFSIRGTVGEAELVPIEIEGANLTQDAARIASDVSIYPRWLLYAVKAKAVVDSLLALSLGAAVRGVNIRDLKRVKVPCPDQPEQRAIAHFLDRTIAKIDTLVAKKRTLIERLKEKRTALISRTITRSLPPDAARAAGLDPYPKLKSSGVDPVGEIPERWQVRRLKYFITRIEQGWSPECDSSPAAADEWGVVKAGCCNGGRFDSSENKRLPDELEPPTHLELQPGDILMSRASGSEQFVGSVAMIAEITRERLLLSDKTYRLRCDTTKIVPRLVPRFFQCPVGRFQIEAVIRGASGLAKNISQSDVRRLVFPLPPLREQEVIAQFLDGEVARVDQMIGKIEAAIDRLQEYRTALITAAVTGKIDVRNEARHEAATPADEDTLIPNTV
jgi:type I restriction enzyme, S subunit